tara:strand:- start:50 stop:799 length:750 start_codon:yes stop_codon:yes gene_type:complete
MHRFYLPPERMTGGDLTLDERESHHAVNVLRLRQGDPVAVLDGSGNECTCEVTAADARATRLAVRQYSKTQPLPYRITLLQAMTKGKSMDFIIQKATELCVHRIVPLEAGRSVVKIDDVEARIAKWQAIAIDSIKQCGCPWLPIIEAPMSPRESLVFHGESDLTLIASLQGGTRHPREWVMDHLDEHGDLPRDIAVWIGPEGDFTPAEVNDIQSAGVKPITLGQVILRSETAAVYCLSALNYELQAPRS